MIAWLCRTTRIALILTGTLAHATGLAGGDPSADPCRLDRDCSGYYRCIERACTVPPAVLGLADEKAPTIEFLSDRSSRARFFVELADDRFERARGLGQRPSMAQEWGMLFVFPETVHHDFTMKPMRFPLDLIFIDERGQVVDIVEDAQPQVPIVASSKAYKFVLELNAGLVRRQGVQIGNRIKLRGARFHPDPAGS